VNCVTACGDTSREVALGWVVSDRMHCMIASRFQSASCDGVTPGKKPNTRHLWIGDRAGYLATSAKLKALTNHILPAKSGPSVTGVTVRRTQTGKGSRAPGRCRRAWLLSCGAGLGPADHFAFITSRMRSKSSREEYSIRILPLPLRSVMATRTPSARCSSCSASLTFGSTIRTFSAFSGG